MTWHCTHVGHRVVAAGRSDAQKLHVRVSLHRLKDLFQCWDGNVLQHRQKDITFTFLQRIYTYWSWAGYRRNIVISSAASSLFRSRSADLDVVEVDFSQAAVVVVDSLQGFLHVGGVRRLVGEDLEGIWFHHTCRRHNIQGQKKYLKTRLSSL